MKNENFDSVVERVMLADGVTYNAKIRTANRRLSLELYGLSGERHSVSLPFEQTQQQQAFLPKLFAVHTFGLILIDASNCIKITNPLSSVPSLYSLSHPLDEIRPVSSQFEIIQGTSPRLWTIEDGTIVNCCEEVSEIVGSTKKKTLVVVYSFKEKCYKGLFFKKLWGDGVLAVAETIGIIAPEISLDLSDEKCVFKHTDDFISSNVFVFNGISKSLYVGIVKQGFLEVFNSNSLNEVAVKKIPCLIANSFSVKLGSELRHLLIIVTSKIHFEIYLDLQKIGHFTLEQENIALLTGQEQRIVKIKQCADSEIEIIYDNGISVKKSFSCFPKEDIASTCISLLIKVIPCHIWSSILSSFNNQQENNNGDWNKFSSALISNVINLTENGTRTAQKEHQETLTESAWNEMIQSDYHLLSSEDPSLNSVWINPPSYQSNQINSSLKCEQKWLEVIANSLHFVYEDSKLSTFLNNSRKKLAKLLIQLCSVIGWKCHADHYFRDFPVLSSLFPSNFIPICDNEPTVPDIYKWILLEISGIDKEFANFEITNRLKSICEIYRIVSKQTETSLKSLEIVSKMVEEGITKEILDSIPFGISLPLREACIKCRSFDLSESAISNQSLLRLIGRTDLLSQRNNINETHNNSIEEELLLSVFQSKLTPIPSPPKPPPELNVGVSNRFLQLQQRALAAAGIAPPPTTPAPSSTNQNQQKIEAPRIKDGTECDDQIVSMLFPNDKRINEVKNLLSWSDRVVIPIEETTGTEWVAEQQIFLLKFSQRTLSLPIGRGAFVLSLDRLASTSENNVLEAFPQLQLDGKNLSGHDVPFDNKPIGQAISWPNFHNGVATALRHGADLQNTTRAWLSQTPQESDRDSYAGFLFGLGLQGLLPPNPTGRLIELLYSRGSMEGVALLLGLASENIGTMNESVFKTLSMHVPFLRPAPAAATLNSNVIDQATAIAADSVDIPTQTIAAALIGVGLVFRGTGHRRAVEVLLEELTTQPSTRALSDRESYALSAGLGLGLVSLGCGDSIPGVEDLRLVDTLSKLFKGGPESEQRKGEHKQESVAAAQAQRPSLFLTNGLIDTNVTAPGALLALGLMFFATNNSSVLTILRNPQTSVELTSIRPDHLLLRELAFCLVSWNCIQPTQEWIDSQIPKFMSRINSLPQGKSPRFRVYHFSIIVGACLAIGLKFAGTNYLDARNILFAHLNTILSLPLSTVSVSDRILRASRETFIDNLCIALSLVVSGTGDLEVLKCFRSIRVKAGASAIEGSYGHNMARHMALGFLFLGGGLLTFSNSKEAISSLICALFPQWPISPSDNSLHLQALRHLYALAVECRMIISIDAVTHRPCFVPLKVTTIQTLKITQQQVISLMSPSTLPCLNDITEIQIESQRYFPFKIRLNSSELPLIRAGKSVRSCPFVIFVKRKAGFLPYSEDPKGFRSIESEVLFSQNWLPTNSVNISTTLQSFSDDSITLAFVKHFCSSLHGNDYFESFCSNALLDCVINDQNDLLSVYLSLFNSTLSTSNPFVNPNSSEYLSNVALILTSLNRKTTLLNESLLEMVDDKLKQFIDGNSDIQSLLQDYVISGLLPKEYNSRVMLFGVVSFLNIPDLSVLGLLRKIMKSDDKSKFEHSVELLQTQTTPQSILTLFKIYN